MIRAQSSNVIVDVWNEHGSNALSDSLKRVTGPSVGQPPGNKHSVLYDSLHLATGQRYMKVQHATTAGVTIR